MRSEVQSTPAHLAIDAQDLAKSFGREAAVTSVSLIVPRGEIVALLGPNGAGKTTTIAMLLGLLPTDRGTVRLFEREPKDAVAAGLVGAMLQDGGLMPGVRVRELITMLAGLFPSPVSVDEALRVAQLDGLENRRVDRLSGGQRQRVRIAAALIGNPELLILDEPTAAMDVKSRRSFWTDMSEQAARGRTIVFSTHYLEEADNFADRIVLIRDGFVIADGSPSVIKASLSTRIVSFSVRGAQVEEFSCLPGVVSTTVHRNRVEIYSDSPDALLRAVLSKCGDAFDIEVSGAGLEDAFLALTAS